MPDYGWIILCVVLFLIGGGVSYLIVSWYNSKNTDGSVAKARRIVEDANKDADAITDQAENKAKKILADAEEKGQNIAKQLKEEAKKEAADLKIDAEKEIKERKIELANQENRLNQREQNIDRRDNVLLSKENALEEKQEALLARQNKQEEAFRKKEEEIRNRFGLLEKRNQEIDDELARVSQLSLEEARKEVLKRVEDQMSQEIAAYMKQKEDEAKEASEGIAKNIIGLAIDKYSQEVISEKTVSSVSLPNDEMKGRIIGREGRNIRTLEQMLGVDIIIDDTPEVITVSCFDPIRRETARLALEYLIKDGRIQPGRIEEVVEKAKNDVQKSVHEAGINAAFKLGLPRINKELLDYVGRLKYRTSYGQNVLDHSIQVAYLSGIMASELGLDQNQAKRAGLLHDIGKAADFELEGSHVEIGARLAKKYGEDDVVINAIESHHGDVEAKYIISHLVSAADTLSAARPGARSETLENYIKRIEALESICKSYDGVSSSFAMQSGREVRVMVVPEKISDHEAYKLARDIKDRIENEMTYPGQIKVSVVREVRATEVAK